MNRTKHTEFVNGLKSLLQKNSESREQGISSLDKPFDDEDDCVCDDDVKKMLEAKFDELFGPIDDN